MLPRARLARERSDGSPGSTPRASATYVLRRRPKPNGARAHVKAIPASHAAYTFRGAEARVATLPPSHDPSDIPPMYVASTVVAAVAVLPKPSASDLANITS